MVALGDFGILLQGIDGPVALFPCASTPTPTSTEVSCPNGDPSIIVTVTGTSGTINWCDETWNLPGDSGVEKSVCPTTYKEEFTNSIFRYNTWICNPDGNLQNVLQLFRNWSLYSGFFQEVIFVRTSAMFKKDSVSFTSLGGGTSTLQSSIGLLVPRTSAMSGPTFSDVIIKDYFFGSFTNSGITYAWRKGTGWPT